MICSRQSNGRKCSMEKRTQDEQMASHMDLSGRKLIGFYHPYLYHTLFIHSPFPPLASSLNELHAAKHVTGSVWL